MLFLFLNCSMKNLGLDLMLNKLDDRSILPCRLNQVGPREASIMLSNTVVQMRPSWRGHVSMLVGLV